MNDAENVHQILLRTWLDTYSDFVPREDILGYLGKNYHPDMLRQLLQNPGIVSYVAEVDDILTGYERTLYNDDEKRLYVQQLYILPEYQGLGLGKQLMVLAAERAITFNLDRVWLGVMVSNTSALEWYLKMGYQIVEKEPFNLEKTAVEHYIGFVPIDRILVKK